MLLKISELVLSLFVSYIGTLELVFTAKYLYHWLNRHGEKNSRSIEEIQEYILSELTDADFKEEQTENLELANEDPIHEKRLINVSSSRSSVDRAKNVQKDDNVPEENVNVNKGSNVHLNLSDPGQISRPLTPGVVDELKENDNGTGALQPYEEHFESESKEAMKTYHSDVFISQTEIKEKSAENGISTAEINLYNNFSFEEKHQSNENFLNEKPSVYTQKSDNTIAILDVHEKKIYDPTEKQAESDYVENFNNFNEGNELFDSEKHEHQEKKSPEVEAVPNRRDSTNQIKSYCDENVIMGGVEDSLLSRLTWQDQKLRKSRHTTETTTLRSQKFSKYETESEIVQLTIRNIAEEESSVKNIATNFLKNERAEEITLKGLSDFYDFNASIDINKSVNTRKPRPARFQPFPEVYNKRLDYEHTLKDLSDFLDYNVKMHRAGLQLSYPKSVQHNTNDLTSPSEEIIHSEYTSRKSSFNIPSHSITPMNCLSPSPSNLMFFPEDQRDIEYLRRKYQESSAHQATYPGVPSEQMYRGTGSSEELSRFQRSRSQSRSIGDILAVEGLELRRSSKRLVNAPISRSSDFLVKDGSDPDHILLNNLEDEEYHHYRRYSLCQECQVEEYPEDDDYICIRKIEVRQLSPYEIQLSFNDFPSEASSVCATPLPDDDMSSQDDYYHIHKDDAHLKSQDELENIDYSEDSSKVDSGVSVEPSFNYQMTANGNNSDQYGESNEDESFSSGYSQRGYLNTNLKLDVMSKYESTVESKTWNSINQSDIMEDSYPTWSAISSNSPNRIKSTSPAWSCEEVEYPAQSRTSFSPYNRERETLSKDKEDSASIFDIEESKNDDAVSEKESKTSKKTRRNKKKQQAQENEAYSHQNSFDNQFSLKNRIESPMRNQEMKLTASPSPSRESPNKILQQHVSSSSLHNQERKLAVSPSPNREFPASSSPRQEISNKTLQHCIANQERKLTASPSPKREIPSNTSQHSIPSSASKSILKGSFQPMSSDPSNRERNNSLGNFELIKDGSMYPWF